MAGRRRREVAGQQHQGPRERESETRLMREQQKEQQRGEQMPREMGRDSGGVGVVIAVEVGERVQKLKAEVEWGAV